MHPEALQDVLFHKFCYSVRTILLARCTGIDKPSYDSSFDHYYGAPPQADNKDGRRAGRAVGC